MEETITLLENTNSPKLGDFTFKQISEKVLNDAIVNRIILVIQHMFYFYQKK